MSLTIGNFLNCLLITGLCNNLTIVTQGGIPVKLHNLSSHCFFPSNSFWCIFLGAIFYTDFFPVIVPVV